MRPGLSAVVAAASYSTKRGRLKDRAMRHVPGFDHEKMAPLTEEGEDSQPIMLSTND